MQKNDLRAGKIVLILFNVANAMIVGFALGRFLRFPYEHVILLLIVPPISLILGVAFAIYLAWREHAPRS
jgi:hypothetical protein